MADLRASFDRILPSTTVPLARAAAGLLVALGIPVGLLALRWARGTPPAAEVAAHAGTYAYVLASTAALVSFFGYALGRVELKLRRANAMLMDLATRDDLTGLANARVFHTELPRMISLARRAGIPLSLLLLDLDHFKQINDQHGHAAGDDVLRAVGQSLRQGRRREDVVARVGGEEIAMILPGVDPRGAKAAAERIAASIRALRVPSLGGDTVSASIGIAGLDRSDTPGTLYERADRALYTAKRAGRDRVETDARSEAPPRISGAPRPA